MVAQLGCYTVFGKHSACFGNGAGAGAFAFAFPFGVEPGRAVNVRIAPPAAPAVLFREALGTLGVWAGRRSALLDTCTRPSHALTQAVWKSKKIKTGIPETDIDLV